MRAFGDRLAEQSNTISFLCSGLGARTENAEAYDSNVESPKTRKKPLPNPEFLL